jgi:uncharacterized repeat protein (TIGR01451 family)
MNASCKLTRSIPALLLLIGLVSVARAADPGALPALTKTAPRTAIAGGAISYTITLINGGTDLTTVTVSDALPAGLTFVSVSVNPAANWTCRPPSAATGAVICTRNGNVVVAGETATFVITARVCPETPCNTTIANQAILTSGAPSGAVSSQTTTTTIQSQSDLTITSSGTPPSVLAGDNVTYTLNVSNNGPSNSAGTVVTDTLPAGWSVVSVATSVGDCAVSAVGITCNLRTLGAANQCATSFPTNATITIVAHVPSVCQPARAVNTATVAGANCLEDPTPGNNTTTFPTAVNQPNLGPGECIPPTREISDDKPGSVLFYNFYTSNPGDPNQNNTRISLTNIHPTRGVAAHLFFVDGSSCSIADSFICLTPNQTVSFLMSDVDPGTSGYLIAIAVDGPPGFEGGNNTGCPISFNFLIGSAAIKMTNSPLRETVLAAESSAAEYGSPLPGCDPNSPTATLPFDGTPNGYSRLPRMLAVSNIPSRADSNSTLLVINRIGGNLMSSAAPIGSIFGILYDDTETGLSFSFSTSACQFKSVLSNNFPRTAPRFETVIPAGRSGWMKFWGADDIGILGATLNQNINANTLANGFDGGHNLHKLRLTSSVRLTVPIIPPSC